LLFNSSLALLFLLLFNSFLLLFNSSCCVICLHMLLGFSCYCLVSFVVLSLMILFFSFESIHWKQKSNQFNEMLILNFNFHI
jgi:hypothetical protein